LKDEALALTLWRTHSARFSGPVLRQTTEHFSKFLRILILALTEKHFPMSTVYESEVSLCYGQSVKVGTHS